MARPDAVMIPASAKRQGRLVDRVASVAEIAEPLLEVDRDAGERAWIRQQPHAKIFVTRDPHDSLRFPGDHPRANQPRYTWEPENDDGIQLGYLVEGADAGDDPA